MGKFGVVFQEEVVKQLTKEDLQKAKGWLTEAHDRLRNHEKHKLADEVWKLIERTNALLNKLSFGRTL